MNFGADVRRRELPLPLEGDTARARVRLLQNWVSPVFTPPADIEFELRRIFVLSSR